MSQHKNYSQITGLCDTWNDVDFITSPDRVVISITTRNPDADGLRRRQSVALQLTVDDARQFLRLLSSAINAADEVADPRQTALWAPITDRVLNSNRRRLS